MANFTIYTADGHHYWSFRFGSVPDSDTQPQTTLLMAARAAAKIDLSCVMSDCSIWAREGVAKASDFGPE